MKVPDVYGPLKEFFSGVTWPFTWLGTKAASVGLLIFLFVFIAAAAAAGVGTLTDFGSSQPDSSLDTGELDPSCNVIGIEIRDCIMTYRPDNVEALTSSADSPCDTITSSEEVVWMLDEARYNSSIRAVVLQIDSGGGSPVAAEEVAAALKVLGKPSVAWVRQNAASAAYWIASAADTIIASESSDIGSIGVTYSYVDNAKRNMRDGLTYNQLTTGKYKDTGTPDRALTNDERALIQRDLDISLQAFIKAVATNRELSVDKVTALADGSSMLGKMALKNGLIDQLGTKQEVWKQLSTDINDKPNVCWP